jgi:hypothetical protein
MNEPNIVKGDNVASVLSAALEAGDGLLRLTPTWVPRSDRRRRDRKHR